MKYLVKNITCNKKIESSENKKYIVSFPRLGNYVYPIYNMLKRIIDKDKVTVIMPQKMTKKTIELGANSSPDFVCLPFKYNMGNFIESLEMGANFLIQAGGGCRYGYYAEVQEQILKDMGYSFTYVSLLEPEGIKVKKLYEKFKMLNKKLGFAKFAKEIILAIRSINLLDEIETYIRDNYVYEIKKGSFDKIHKNFLERIGNVTNMYELLRLKKEFFKKVHNVKLNTKRDDIIKIGIIGELYTSMEPFSSLFLEEELARLGAHVKRYTTVTYLLFEKSKSIKKHIKYANKYISHALGADGTETIAHALELINKGYDGLIHIKPFGCTPEINAMPILQKIANENEIPVMYLTFDAQSSRTGFLTRIEAFYDMLLMKKEKEKISLKENKDNYNDKKKEDIKVNRKGELKLEYELK